MRILHLINYFNDYLHYQENYLIHEQSKQGHDVQLITSDRYYPFKNYKKIYYSLLGNRIIKKREYKFKGANIIRKKVFFETKNYAQCLFFNFYDIIKYRPNVIHIHNTGAYTFLTTLIYRIFFDVKIFIDCHQDIYNTKGNFFNKANNFFWRIIYNLFDRQIKKFLPINISSKNFIINNYKIKLSKIEILPLGFPASIKFENFKLNKLRNSLNFKQDDIIIFYSGKMNEKKKIFDILNLMEKLLKKNKKFKLLLIGDANKRYGLKIHNKIKLINSIFTNSIKWISFQKQQNLALFMQISNYAIWPGTPSISIQEAINHGNIVLLPKTSPSFDLICDKKLEFFNNDLRKVAKNILFIENNKMLKKKILLKNKKIIKKLKWEEISKKLSEIYEKS